jgi:hypothetical protein
LSKSKRSTMPVSCDSGHRYSPRPDHIVAGVDLGRLAGCAAEKATDVAVAVALDRLGPKTTEILRSVPPITRSK